MKKVAILSLFFVSLSATQLKVPSQYSTIQLAIDAASAGDTVFVAAGNYTENITFKGKNIVVLGEDKETTSIDGYNNASVVTFNSGESYSAELKRFTIKNGKMTSYSQGSDGGGIHIKDSGPTLSELIITNNKAYRGGGISIDFPSSVHSLPMPSINSSIIIGNNADDGSGIFFYGSIQGPIVNNCLIVSNTGGFSTGVEVYDEWTMPTLINVTIANHDIGIEQSYGGYVTVRNSIIWENDNSVYGREGSSSTLKYADYSIISGGHTGPGNIDKDPKFVNVITTGDEESDYHLKNSSPAIGAGIATFPNPLSTDIEGNPRPNPAGSNPDIGAYEHKLGAPNLAPAAFEWVSSALDTINITKTNLTDTHVLKWSESVDTDTIKYLISIGVGQLPADLIFETADTSLMIYYQNIIDYWPLYFNDILSKATLKISVSATDGFDTVKVSGDDRLVFVNRYDYLSIADEGIPTEFTLHENYPNPFNPTTSLRFDLPEVTDATITIFNMLGQRVRTFNMNDTPAGYHSIQWDATNDYGDPVGAGVYLYQLKANEFVKTNKMVLLK